MFRSILCVCAGNICRSPYAEVVLKRYLLTKDIDVASAGIYALENHYADKNAQVVAAKNGLDLSEHKAQQLTQDLMLEYNLILVMEKKQQIYIQKKFPFSAGKVHLYDKFANKDVIDPYKRSYEAFETMAYHLQAATEKWLVAIL